MAKLRVWVELLAIMCILMPAGGKVVTKDMEDTMRNFIKNMIDTMIDSNGMRFLVPGIIRLCFHDCVEKCDGCVDTRRKVQATNNGLEATWRPLREVHTRRFSKFCSLADFIALTCVVATEYSAEKSEEQGLCTRNPFLFENDCMPKVEVRWGRQTCEHAQKMEELREIPDANQDPYVWFKDNLKFEPRQIVCIMGSHSLGRLRGNETGFEGNFTTHPEALTNGYYKRLLDPSAVWKQNKVTHDVDGKAQTRFQWEIGQDHLIRTNSDMMLRYLMKPNKKGKVNCKTEHSDERMKVCEEQDGLSIVEELANDNKAFVQCFGEAMTSLIKLGYEDEELAPTGVEFVEPPILGVSTEQLETTTTATKKEAPKPRKRKGRRRTANRLRNSRRDNGRNNGGFNNRFSSGIFGRNNGGGRSISNSQSHRNSIFSRLTNRGHGTQLFGK